LETKGIELNMNRSEKNLQATDYGLDIFISVTGIKENIEILYRKNMDESELNIPHKVYILPVDKATDDELYVVEDTEEINSMSYGEFVDMVMLKLLSEEEK